MRLTATSSIFLLLLCSAIFCSAKRKWCIYQDCEGSKRGSMGCWKSVKGSMRICTSCFCIKCEESQQHAHVAINMLQIDLEAKGFTWLSFESLKRSRAISCNLSPSHSLSLSLLTSLDVMMLLCMLHIDLNSIWMEWVFQTIVCSNGPRWIFKLLLQA